MKLIIDRNSITSLAELPTGWVVLADGGCEGNELPRERMGERTMMGSYAVYHDRLMIRSRGLDRETVECVHTESFPNNGYATNQLAELWEMETALTYIMELKERRPSLTNITVISDSLFAMGYASGETKPGNKVDPALKQSHKDLLALVATLKDKGVQIAWRHASNEWVKTQLGH